jgi:hypothetical protein
MTWFANSPGMRLVADPSAQVVRCAGRNFLMIGSGALPSP